MTVSSENRRNRELGNDSLESFPFTFGITTPTELTVEIADENDENAQTLEWNDDYTLDPVLGPWDQGGNVDLVAGPLTDGWSITMRLNPPLVQEESFANQDSFEASKHEETYDYQVRILLALKEEIDRCLKIAVATGSEAQEINASLEQEVTDIGVARDTAVAAAETFTVLDDDTLGGGSPSTTSPASQSSTKAYIDTEVAGVPDFATEAYVDAAVATIEVLDDDTLGGGTPSTTQAATQSSTKVYADEMDDTLNTALEDVSAHDLLVPMFDASIGTGSVTLDALTGESSLVLIAIYNNTGAERVYSVQTPGDDTQGGNITVLSNSVGYLWRKTDSSGELTWNCDASAATVVNRISEIKLF